MKPSVSRLEPRMGYAIYIAFFVSGASALILEVIWLRMLRLIFGCTVFATSTVLSAFMAGLALGSFLFGRLADRWSNKVRLYAFLQLGVGVSALLLPLLFNAVTPLHISLYRWQIGSGSFHLTALVHFAITFAILLIPTTLMGGTLPVLCAYFIETRSTLGKRVGMLYGLNTLGAMIGCFGAGFFLIRLFGQSYTLRIAAGLSMLIGALFLILSSRTASVQGSRERREPGTEAAVPEEVQRHAPWILNFVFIAFGLSGMASLGYEVAWTRALVYFTSLDTYAFSAMLTVFLGGLALGSVLYTKLWKTREGLIRRFALLEVGIGISAMCSLVIFSHMRHLNSAVLGWGVVRRSWAAMVGVKFLDAWVALFIPTLLMGATFPLVSQIVTSLRHKGRSIGNIYSVNTLGAIVGSFVAGFVLIPLIGVQRTVILFGGVNLLIGMMLWVLSEGRPKASYVTGGVMVVGVCLIMGWLASDAPMVQWTDYFHDQDKGYKLLYAKDGVAASVSILERKNGIREINLDGKSTAYTNYSDIQVHQYLGHLPMMLCASGKPPQVLVIGFGLGATCWSCLQHEVGSVECVELVREEQETARYFEEQNHGVLSHPKFKWITGDGRNHLLAIDRMYDVISMNAIHPKFSPSLYTSDFYKLVRARLADDGIACTWITTDGVTRQEFKMLLRSFWEVFPEATLWDVNSQHMVMIASKKPLSIDYGRWLKQLENEQVRSHLKEVHLDHPHAMLSHFLMDASSMHDYFGDVAPHSDDRPYVEFEHEITETYKAKIFNDLMSYRTSVLPMLTNLPADEDVRLKLYDNMVRYYYAMKEAMKGRYFLSVVRDRSMADPFIEKAMTLWPDNEAFAHMLGKCSHFVEGDRTPPFQKWWAEGWLNEQAEKWAEAIAAYRQCIAEKPNFSKAYKSLILAYERSGRYFEAIQTIRQLMKLEKTSKVAQLYLALLVQQAFEHRDEDVVSVTFEGKEIPFDRKDIQTDLFLAKAYSEAGHPARAEQILRLAAERTPTSAKVYEVMGYNALLMGHFRDAERYFERALQLDPERKLAADQLGLLERYIRKQIHPERMESETAREEP